MMDCTAFRYHYRGRCYCADCNGARMTETRRSGLDFEIDRPPFYPNTERYDWDRTRLADYGPTARQRLVAKGLLS